MLDLAEHGEGGFIPLKDIHTVNVTVYMDMRSSGEVPTAVRVEEDDSGTVRQVSSSASAPVQQSGSTVYAVTVPVTYTYEDINKTPIYDAKVYVNLANDSNHYDYEVNLGLSEFWEALDSGEVWIDYLGESANTPVSYDAKTSVTDSIGSKSTKRIFFSFKNSGNEAYWYNNTPPKIYYYRNGGSLGDDDVTWDDAPAMTYAGHFEHDNIDNKIYFYDIPARADRVSFQKWTTGNDNKTEVISNPVEGRRYYISGQNLTNDDTNYGLWYVTGFDEPNHASPFISAYYDNIIMTRGATSSYAVVTGYQNTVSVESSDTGVVTVNNDYTLNAVAPGTATLTIRAWGYIVGNLQDDQGNNYYEKTVTVTVRNQSKPGDFAVMSYESNTSTVSAYLADTFALTPTLTVGGEDWTDDLIVTQTGDTADGTAIYTLKYAKPNAITGYGSIVTTAAVTATCSSDKMFDKWTRPADDPIIYTEANATLRLKNGAYVLRYGYHYDIVYNYVEYDVGKTGTYIYDDGIEGKEESEYQTAKTYIFSDIKLADKETATVESAVAAKAPALFNNYYRYNIDSELITVNDGAATITVNMTSTPKTYSFSINGTEFSSGHHYQSKIEVTSADAGYAAGTDIKWILDGEVIFIGPKCRLYITKTTNVETAELIENEDNSMDGKSVITSAGFELKNQNGKNTLTRDFYIRNFYDKSTATEGMEFVGAGTVFKAVTGTPAKEEKSAIEAIVSRNVTPGTTGFISTQTDKTSGYTLTYTPRGSTAEGAARFVYSNALHAYHYIFALTFPTYASYANRNVRVYSYFIYKDSNGEYQTQVSDNYSQASMYQTVPTP